jgi:ketosteroid isomerase-like protein
MERLAQNMKTIGIRMALLGMAAVGLAGAAGNAELEEAVRKAETGFAKSMADRDRKAFASFLAEDAIFFAGTRPLKGAGAVAAGWKRFFDGTAAPFSWAPETVAVLDSGSLALSTGPVRDPAGKQIGTFNSVWRKEKDGQWKVVFDRGCPPCNCDK